MKEEESLHRDDDLGDRAAGERPPTGSRAQQRHQHDDQQVQSQRAGSEANRRPQQERQRHDDQPLMRRVEYRLPGEKHRQRHDQAGGQQHELGDPARPVTDPRQPIGYEGKDRRRDDDRTGHPRQHALLPGGPEFVHEAAGEIDADDHCLDDERHQEGPAEDEGAHAAQAVEPRRIAQDWPQQRGGHRGLHELAHDLDEHHRDGHVWAESDRQVRVGRQQRQSVQPPAADRSRHQRGQQPLRRPNLGRPTRHQPHSHPDRAARVVAGAYEQRRDQRAARRMAASGHRPVDCRRIRCPERQESTHPKHASARPDAHGAQRTSRAKRINRLDALRPEEAALRTGALVMRPS